ncbi:hypothetical protein ACFU53_03370 [Streptomyces sp. NPDC057474]|uniref:hypothetical protein n=1 Tax=Streptomyces sp. NPDC057474 TaxID=3346144 RepID=UPI0036C9085F
MTNTWIPQGVAVTLTVVVMVLLLVHVRHLFRAGPQARLWHGVHVLAALGMIDMTVPTDLMPVPATAAGGVFVGAASLAGGYTLVGPIRGTRRWSWLWALATVHLATMAYMFTTVVPPSDGLTLTLATWALVDAALWASGPLAARVRTLSETAASAGTPGRWTHAAAGYTRSVRVTPAVMGLVMAYMLIAMQFGGSTTHGDESEGETPDMIVHQHG